MKNMKIINSVSLAIIILVLFFLMSLVLGFVLGTIGLASYPNNYQEMFVNGFVPSIILFITIFKFKNQIRR